MLTSYNFFSHNSVKTSTDRRLLTLTLIPPTIYPVLQEAVKISGSNEIGFFGHLFIGEIYTEDGYKTRIQIPVSLYCPPQSVSSATISFEDLSIANEQAKRLQSEIDWNTLERIATLFDTSKIQTHGFSIHRHPGCFGFSATDLDANERNPGIIYARIFKQEGETTKPMIQADAIMCVEDDRVKIHTVEARELLKDPRDKKVLEIRPLIEKFYTETPKILHPHYTELATELLEVIAAIYELLDKLEFPYDLREEYVKKPRLFSLWRDWSKKSDKSLLREGEKENVEMTKTETIEKHIEIESDQTEQEPIHPIVEKLYKSGKIKRGNWEVIKEYAEEIADIANIVGLHNITTIMTEGKEVKVYCDVTDNRVLQKLYKLPYRLQVYGSLVRIEL